MLRFLYEEVHNTKKIDKQLPVYGCTELKQYLKSKKDADRGNNKMPGESQRINEMLEQYPNFNILIEKLSLEKYNKKKGNAGPSNKMDMDIIQMQKIINIT